MSIFGFMKGKNAGQAQASQNTTQSDDRSQDMSNMSNEGRPIYPSPNIKPVQFPSNLSDLNSEDKNTDAVSGSQDVGSSTVISGGSTSTYDNDLDQDVSRDLAGQISDEEIDRILAEYSEADSSSSALLDDKAIEQALGSIDTNQSVAADAQVGTLDNQSQLNLDMNMNDVNKSQIQVNDQITMSDQTSGEGGKIEEQSTSSEIAEGEHKTFTEIPLPQYVPEAGELEFQHFKVDNRAIQDSPQNVTVINPDGVVETMYREDDGVVETMNRRNDYSNDYSTDFDDFRSNFQSQPNSEQSSTEKMISSDEDYGSDGQTNLSFQSGSNEVSKGQGSLTTEFVDDPSRSEKEGQDESSDKLADNFIEQIDQKGQSINLRSIRSISLVGLNDTEGVYEDLLSKLLNFIHSLPKNVEIIIDSNKMAGGDLLKKVDPKFSITGVYLKPFYSNYSDEAGSSVFRINYRYILYSNYFEKLTYIIDNSDVVVIPVTTGLVNLANVSVLLALQYIYRQQFKSVILWGLGWREFIEFMNLSAEESESIIYAETVDELLERLVEIDTSLYHQQKQIQTVELDLRERGDEKVFLRGNIQ
ncbi:hypothetical protein D6810_03285 [Candidatus Dojkabacteria bacterium]|uniref:Uncharacterized protein n=1 Tax=Candidatus Dojkabacteria bacterium TaxID=2099670 RepID=A0A3M0Z0W0_9BACT|nr:MAG: hypothetical protein D6810_03285 [Candidatus Dojkabacteria bacterium]